MSEPLTDAELAEIEARVILATKGDWEAWPLPHMSVKDGTVTRLPGYTGAWLIRARFRDDQGRRVTSFVAECNTRVESNEANAQLMAHAHDDIPRLLADLRRLRTGASAFETAMKELFHAEGHDKAAFHSAADKLLCAALEQLDYGGGVAIYRKAEKWYA
jgi:hypothetical protein